MKGRCEEENEEEEGGKHVSNSYHRARVCDWAEGSTWAEGASWLREIVGSGRVESIEISNIKH